MSNIKSELLPLSTPTPKPSPDSNGRFGRYGGRYVPETLMQPILELESAYLQARTDASFHRELADLLQNFVGRQTPLMYAKRLSQLNGSDVKIYLKREDLAHTGAHKINNAVGQILLARRMGKKRIVAETGAGQHGVATAAAAARFGLECVIYMGSEDVRRQAPNVRRMEILGAQVMPVTAGSRTLKDAVSEAMRDWVSNIQSTYYLLGSALGPHPYPMMVRDFQAVIGNEARAQILDCEGRLPNELIACVGGGSNAIGLFHAFVMDQEVRLTGVEAGGEGTQLGQHAARFQGGEVGVFQGSHTYVLQDEHGQVAETRSVSAGLDYAAVGPEHSYLRDISRAQYVSISDSEALAAFHLLSRQEGILPALESSHAVAYALKKAKTAAPGSLIIVNLSGRGDKDLEIVRLASERQNA
jgi:tryptophan synthase beta chain